MKSITRLASAALVALVALVTHGPASAYQQYSTDSTDLCAACHGDFRDSPYTSLSDGQNWGDDLHDVHRNTMLSGSCEACHSPGGRFPVLLGSSDVAELPGLSCAGCHGRAEDGTGTGTEGYAAGLRQHHWRAGVTTCVGCHSDSNPANKTLVGEDVLPPHYANNGGLTNIPDDACNPAPGFPENFAGSTLGLDNDGDDVYDESDSDCAAAVCGNGTLEAGEECDDGNTADGDCCSSTCGFEPSGSPCDDGLFCNIGEICDGGGICVSGGPRDCGDGVGCTVDGCSELSDVCTHTPSDALCDDGLFCNGVETCDVVADCQAGIPPVCDDDEICTDDSCDAGTDDCLFVFDETNDPSCSVSVCGNGILQSGEECDDGNTVDGDCCSSTCAFESAGSACDDGSFCTVGTTCDGAGSCGSGGPRDCGDGVACTIDDCDEIGDACTHTADDALCDDGLFCNGDELCDAAMDCQPGTTVDCDDSDVCTDDSCNESTDICDNVFDETNAPECQDVCNDLDGDGFSPDGGTCGEIDCDDDDAGINPDASELCDDGEDNDCDGFVDAADSACGFDGEWVVRRGPLDRAEYAGSAACADCHASRFEDWRSSLHARMLIRPGDAQAAGFPLPDFDPGSGVNVQSWSDVLFVIGQKWRTELVDDTGSLQGVRWNYLFGRWDTINNGQTTAYDCGACHTTGYSADDDFLDDQGEVVPGIVGSWFEYGVGCEACHGPGAEHADDPSADNINRIFFDWYDPNGDGQPDPVALRSSVVCGNCHYRDDRVGGPSDRGNHAQYNEWLVSSHSSTLQPTGVNTYCAKCHSPGNADLFAEEHFFDGFEPGEATHNSCISCHDPHRSSHARWAMLDFPADGRQDPRDDPPPPARYRGSDDNPTTRDHETLPSENADLLCGDCHRMMVGFRRHVDARPPEEIVLEPPFASGQTFVVPHREHGEEGYAQCIDCHMHPSRRSANPGDVRSHSLLPNEWVTGEFRLQHFDETCGQCHDEAAGCVWCHADFNFRPSRLWQPRRRDFRGPGRTIRESR